MALQSVVVTGAAQGIGLGIATRLLRDGYAVVMVDIDAEKLADSALQLSSTGHVVTLEGDVALKSTHEHAAELAMGLGTLTGWVNNAGYNIIAPIHEIDQETF